MVSTKSSQQQLSLTRRTQQLGQRTLRPFLHNHATAVLKVPRGGEQDAPAVEEPVPDGSLQETNQEATTSSSTSTTAKAASTSIASAPVVSKLLGAFAAIGKSYSAHLEMRPILTKSCTAGLIFGLSDLLAQNIEGGSSKSEDGNKLDWTRMIATTLVGLLYFGPAAHYWYEWIFRLIPGTSLVSTIYKAFWGQVLFGPSFTCIFFATSLLQSGEFSLKSWWTKIRTDLPGAWLAGVGYWPIVDLISYSVIPINLIPLFVNMASLVWTVYLSLVANRGKGN